MSPELALARPRRLLFGVAAAAFAGTIVELVLAEHWEEAAQLIPLVLAMVGLATVVAGAFRPSRATLWLLRAAMLPVALGTLLGVREHLEGNAEIFVEVNAGAALPEAIWGALSGAAPVLAPGILVLAAVIALAATYQHPALAAEQP